MLSSDSYLLVVVMARAGAVGVTAGGGGLAGGPGRAGGTGACLAGAAAAAAAGELLLAVASCRREKPSLTW